MIGPDAEDRGGEPTAEPPAGQRTESPPPPCAPAPAERRTASVELLWDLVFVFSITQVTTLLAGRASWERFGEAMLVLALVWWAWSAFVWAANAHDENSRVLRGHLLAATILIFIVALAVPHAFGGDAVLFACAYAAVRVLHLTLYGAAARGGRASRRGISGFQLSTSVGIVLLIVGAVAGGWARTILWIAAVAIDYGGPAGPRRDRLRELQHVAVAHFADRYGDFVILCLGESVVSVGVGVADANRRLDAGLIVSAGFALVIAIAMWWTYFDQLAEAAQRRLRDLAEPVLAATDGFSYGHLGIVAGIIIEAGGIRLLVHNSVTVPMPDPGRLLFCAGVAVYLLALELFAWRLLGRAGIARPLAAAALVVLWAAGGGLPAWLTTVLCAGCVAAGAALAGAPTLTDRSAQPLDQAARDARADGSASAPT